jgi:hypothetical protein
LGKNWRELSVGVLVAAALPGIARQAIAFAICREGSMWIAEPDVDLQPPCEFWVAGHFRSTVVGHTLAQDRRQSFHLS